MTFKYAHHCTLLFAPITISCPFSPLLPSKQYHLDGEGGRRQEERRRKERFFVTHSERVFSRSLACEIKKHHKTKILESSLSTFII